MKMKDKEIESLMILAYHTYRAGKENRKYDNPEDLVPQSIIKLYYTRKTQAPFSNIITKFKDRYIFNENELERVKEPTERDGLESIYDYIQGEEWKNVDNIFILPRLHQLLYSKVPYPEFGGSFRKMNSFLVNGGDNIAVDWTNVTKEMMNLFPIYNEISKMSEEINENNSSTQLIPYIDKCIELKCNIIRIHPFADGNGRTSRALLNIFLKKVNLPPTYVEVCERDDYIDAMDQAIRCNNSTPIKNFYYYKICDSIYDLDIIMRPDDAKSYEEPLDCRVGRGK